MFKQFYSRFCSSSVFFLWSFANSPHFLLQLFSHSKLLHFRTHVLFTRWKQHTHIFLPLPSRSENIWNTFYAQKWHHLNGDHCLLLINLTNQRWSWSWSVTNSQSISDRQNNENKPDFTPECHFNLSFVSKYNIITFKLSKLTFYFYFRILNLRLITKHSPAAKYQLNAKFTFYPLKPLRRSRIWIGGVFQ